MASLENHLAKLRFYKSQCAEAMDSPDEEKKLTVVEAFWARKFFDEGGGMFWTHLEEIAALAPDQEKLARCTEQMKAKMENTDPIPALLVIADLMRAGRH